MSTAAAGRNSLFGAAMFLIAGVFVYSAQDVIIKWISGGYPVHEIVLIRSIAGIAPLLLLAHFTGGLRLLRTGRYGIHALRALLMFVSYTTFYMALAALPLAECVALFFSAPFFITLLSAFMLDERVDIRCWISVGAGLIGVVLMLKPNVAAINPAGLLAVIAAVCYAFSSIITRRIGRTENGVALAFYPIILYAFYAAALGGVIQVASFEAPSHSSMVFLLHQWKVPSGQDLVLMALLGLMVGVAFFCVSQAYRSANPAIIAPLEYIAIPLSVFWGYIVWHEIPDIQSLAAIAIIIGGGLYNFVAKSA